MAKVTTSEAGDAGDVGPTLSRGVHGMKGGKWWKLPDFIAKNSRNETDGTTLEPFWCHAPYGSYESLGGLPCGIFTKHLTHQMAE